MAQKHTARQDSWLLLRVWSLEREHRHHPGDVGHQEKEKEKHTETPSLAYPGRQRLKVNAKSDDCGKQNARHASLQ